MNLEGIPILVVVYVKLAKREEALAIAEFGELYMNYIKTTPSWIPYLNLNVEGKNHENTH